VLNDYISDGKNYHFFIDMGRIPTYCSITREIFPRKLDGRQNFFRLHIHLHGSNDHVEENCLAVVIGVALTPGAAVSYAAPPDRNIVVAREASEGPRGGDNERPSDRQCRGRSLS